MLNNGYVVSITSPPVGDLTPFVDALAQALNAQNPQILQLLERLKAGPVTVTKPIPEAAARQLAQQLERLGFKSQVRVNAQPASASVTTEVLPISGDLESARPTPVTLKRSSLSNRILLSTLIPLLALIAVILGFTAISLPNTVRQLILEGADQLAIAVGNSIELDNPGDENRRLTLLTQQPKVFFVAVNLPDQTTLFRAKNVNDEIVVRTPLSEFIEQNPQGGTYSWTDNRAAAFETIIKQMQSSGQATDSAVKSVQQDIDRTASVAGQQTTLEVRRIGFNEIGGVRQVVPIGSASFVVSVGVIANDSLNIRNNFLLIFGGVALLTTVLIVAIASAALRRVVRPILEMSKIADRISMGEIDEPVPNFGNDELGDLSQSIDRLRISVKVLLERMRSKRNS